MKSFAPDKKMAVLKLVRELTGLGLKDIKDFMEALPKTVKEEVSKSEAEDLVARLREAGAEVEME
jgi:large subunit ribosomal protein L7/L12